MFDIKRICEDPESFDRGLSKRGIGPESARILQIHEKYLSCIHALQDDRTQRNLLSQKVGQSKSQGDEDSVVKLVAEVARLKTSIRDREEEERLLSKELQSALAGIPNLACEDVPYGVGEEDNRLVRFVGEKPEITQEIKTHFEAGEMLGLMDFESAAALSGSRFVVLRGELARLERALGNFMLDLHTREFGYTEVSPPILVREKALFGTGQLPKFAQDQFRTIDERWLIPTAEVPLTNLVAEKILSDTELPVRFAAWTQCFRSEAGAAGRDTRGLIRQHQFSKVELVSVTTPEDSRAELERLCACAEEVLKRLGLHYRVIELCTGDLGFSAQKTYDLEVWLPGQSAYREISSCSLCGDFQARRMNARFRPPGKKEAARYVHTLNGSGLAVGRTLVAILENYQQDQRILVPEVLQPYMGGIKHIGN